MNSTKEQYLSEDGGMYLSAFLRTVVQFIERLNKGDLTDRTYSINPSARKIVVQTKQIRVGNNAFLIQFLVDKDLQMIQVRLIECGQNEDGYKVNGMELGTQYMDIDCNNVDFIRIQTNLAYGNMTRLPENLQISVNQINRGNKGVFDVVSDIIYATVEYANEYAASGSVKSVYSGTLPNGMMVDFTPVNNGVINYSVNFGDILSRSAKMDAMFI